MSELKMPKKGHSAQMLADLQAEHASVSAASTVDTENAATNVTTLQPTPVATTEGAHAATNVSAPEPTHVPTIDSFKTPIADVTPAPSSMFIPAQPASVSTSERDERLAHALRRGAEDEITVVTVRVSASLNRYMDDYTARVSRLNTKRKYRKQDAVLEAFAAFYADHPMPPAPEDEAL